jgi:hypothetical protein
MEWVVRENIHNLFPVVLFHFARLPQWKRMAFCYPFKNNDSGAFFLITGYPAEEKLFRPVKIASDSANFSL